MFTESICRQEALFGIRNWNIRVWIYTVISTKMIRFFIVFLARNSLFIFIRIK